MTNKMLGLIIVFCLVLGSCTSNSKIKLPELPAAICRNIDTTLPSINVQNTGRKPGGDDDDPIIIIEMTVDEQGSLLSGSSVLLSNGNYTIGAQTDQTGKTTLHLPFLGIWHLHVENYPYSDIDRNINIRDTTSSRCDTMRN